MNRIVKELKDSFMLSLGKTADILNVSAEDAFLATKDKIYNAFKLLDEACSEFGNVLLKQTSVNEEDPKDLIVIFSGRNGGKIYSTTKIDKLIINDELLVTKDLQELTKSFYAQDYSDASKFFNLIREKGFITLKEYRK